MRDSTTIKPQRTHRKSNERNAEIAVRTAVIAVFKISKRIIKA